MDLLSLLAAVGTVATCCKGVYDVSGIVIRELNKLRGLPTPRALAFLQDLGCRSDADIRRLVERWDAPAGLTADKREDVIALLINLARGARSHTTHGTATSSFARCTDVISALLTDLRPARHQGQPIGPGWKEWRLERFLGKGAFGEVWLGRNPGVHEPAAFKFFTQPEAREWLAREQHALYEVAKRLGRHPNIIEFKNVVVEDQDYPFLVLEYVGGGSLEEWILSRPELRPALDKREIVQEVARGLARAHGVGIYHHDLKPANVLLTLEPAAHAKIADFGLGEVGSEGEPPAEANVSAAGPVGTWMYLPPEALEPFARPRPAAYDVFALGVLWYQLVVEQLERPPYDFAERLKQAGADGPTVRLIGRCLAHPDRRFNDAVALVDALDGTLPPDEDWEPPADGFDVRELARGYLASRSR
jgi:serine/threonine protein kinase